MNTPLLLKFNFEKFIYKMVYINLDFSGIVIYFYLCYGRVTIDLVYFLYCILFSAHYFYFFIEQD